MAFGQQSGPPAPAKQLAKITQLLEQAGYSSLREARHPLDLTQRQANGKFTRDEATELIDRLLAEAEESGGDDLDQPTPAASAPATGAGVHGAGAIDRAARRLADRQAELVAALPADTLADELVRRGWMCMPPD